ncbi:MAG: sigma-54-dependent Fis family transcriptional regulator, partial [Desulfuromonadales bacterium]|nr:sigma-54-dependent Fis family transcriptional regulator [Desulfuromonadales bacterium]NIS41519.1 sigma-54-dependent Fis family transcriptional regulator [Desulfuromonadales bacterium]
LGQFIQLPGEKDLGAELAAHDYGEALARFETRYLRNLLRTTGGNVEEAARQAGMNMATIYRKLKKYHLKREDLV